MKIDIEQLTRKTPYPEPSDGFFQKMQENVILKTLAAKKPDAKEKTKVFYINFKWIAAAAVVIIAGITAFFGFNNNPEITFANQDIISNRASQISKIAVDTKDFTENKSSKITETNTPKSINKISESNIKSGSKILIDGDNRAFNKFERQDYAVETIKKTESEEELVLVAFTPDQLNDLEKNSEQDVYLDLYN